MKGKRSKLKSRYSLILIITILTTMLSGNIKTKAAVTDVDGFVTRFYEQCLNRQPDNAGLSYWVNRLNANTVSGSGIAQNFIFSSEFINRNVSNDQFLDIMYITFFNRQADVSGKSYWLNKLTKGVSRFCVLSFFVNSSEFTSICTSYGITRGNITLTKPADLHPDIACFVYRFYNKCLGRIPDDGGLNYWVGRLTDGISAGADLAIGFTNSSEFISINPSDSEYVATMYQVFFDRDADSAGQLYWESKLADGNSRRYVLASFVSSQEFKDLCNSYGINNGAVSITQGDLASNGNTTANINNDGIAVLKDDWLYTNTLDSGYIFKLRQDGTEKKQLNWQKSSSLNVTNNYIFFINEQDGYKIYRMNVDGSDNKCINSNDCTQDIIVYGDYIYYINISDTRTIYKMKIDGTGRQKITNDQYCRYINVSGQYLYYSILTMEGGLYRANIDGTDKRLINPDNCSWNILANGSIYFIDESHNNNLYRMNVDGTGIQKLNDDYCTYLNLSGDVLYYRNSNDGGKIYAIKTDGTKRKAVTTEDAYYLNIAGDTIYYKTKQDYGDTHSIKVVNLDSVEEPVGSNAIGNLPGNINNEAFTAYDGNNIFVTDKNTNSIYRYNPDYTNKLYIGNQNYIEINYLNVVNGWVYYAAMSTNSTSSNERIYKIKADGSGEKLELSSKRAFYMNVTPEWIYYTTEEYDSTFTGGGPIHKVKTDGTGEAYVDIKNFDYAAYLNVYEDYIYYVNTKDGMSIYRVKTDGSNREKISNEPARGLNVIGGFIYYVSGYYGDLKRIPVSGGSPVTVANDVAENIIVTNNKIYYVRSSSVYSCNLDGSAETFITNCSMSSQINLAGDFLYYKDNSGVTKMIKIN